MTRTEKELINAINHYKQSLVKYSNDDNVNESKLLYYIHKLEYYPVRIRHLEQTGIGLTVNGLRKLGGEVADAAKNLISKWKRMVVAESNSTGEESEYDDEENEHQNGNGKVDSQPSQTKYVQKVDTKHKPQNHNEDRHKEKSSSSHHKHSSDVKHSSSSSKDEYKHKKIKQEPVSESKSSKRKHESSDDEDEECDVRKVKKERDQEIKSSKRKRDSDTEEFDMRKVKKEDEKSRHKKNKRSSDDETSDDGKKEKYEKSKHRSKESSKRSEKSSSSSSKEKHKDKHKSDSKKKESSSKHEKDKKKSETHKEKRSSSSGGGGKKEKLMLSDGINSESGASFAEALGMLEPSTSKIVKKKVSSSPLTVEKSQPLPSSSKQKTESVPSGLLKPPQAEPVDINISSLLPTITPNYRPLGNGSDNLHQRHKAICDDEALSRVMSSKNQRTKVYSGNKSIWGYVPTLFELCTRVLQDNIDALEYTGGVPYSILKPVLEKATPNQLFQMEHHNPYLIEDTDELWQLHCAREFKNKHREELETWREMYMRCLDEREAKLIALTANIKQSQDKSMPVRQTKLAYVDSFVKPPREIARKQAKNGTKNAITPSVKLASLATAGPAGQVSVPNPGARAVERSGGGSSSVIQKPKKAPLMQKALAAIKNRFRR